MNADTAAVPWAPDEQARLPRWIDTLTTVQRRRLASMPAAEYLPLLAGLNRCPIASHGPVKLDGTFYVCGECGTRGNVWSAAAWVLGEDVDSPRVHELIAGTLLTGGRPA